MVANLRLSPDIIRSKMIKVNPQVSGSVEKLFEEILFHNVIDCISYIQDGSAVQQDYNVKEFALMADMLVSEGKPGKVYKMHFHAFVPFKKTKSCCTTYLCNTIFVHLVTNY